MKGKGLDKGKSSNKLSKESEVLIKMSCKILGLDDKVRDFLNT